MIFAGMGGLGMRLISAIGAICASLMLFDAAAEAEVAPPTQLARTQVSVIELFTSQGCPRCPPADKLIGEFAREPNTIALSYAVNYWDYIGWKDTLASPIFTARQQAYANARQDHEIYTPQVIVGGVNAEPGADKAAIERDAAAQGIRTGIDVPSLKVTEAAGKLHIDIGAAAGGTKSGTAGIYVLRVVHTKTIKVNRGENSGLELTYTNVVRAMNRVGDWDGQAKSFDVLDLKGDDDGFVVILQGGSPGKLGPILTAVKTGGL